MPVPAVNAVDGVSGTSYLPAPRPVAGADDASFAANLTGAVDNVQKLQSDSNGLAIKAVTGDLTDIHAATLAASRAQVTLELVSAVRNKGVEAFNEILRMQA